MPGEDFLVGVEEDRDAAVPDDVEGSLQAAPRQGLELAQGRGGIGAGAGALALEGLAEAGVPRREGPVEEILDRPGPDPVAFAQAEGEAQADGRGRVSAPPSDQQLTRAVRLPSRRRRLRLKSSG